MSDQVQSQSSQPPEPEATTECSICGRVPGPAPECEICHGNQSFTRQRQFTLSEERRGRETDPERYSRTGNVSPKVVNLPGSFNPTVPTTERN